MPVTDGADTGAGAAAIPGSMRSQPLDGAGLDGTVFVAAARGVP